MIRIILRNIQFYLLLSSALLALLAFNHLNWYTDHNLLPHSSHSSILDNPSIMYNGSPDERAGTLYYGEESKEIGIWKFKVGLFKFALPMFAKEDFWEESSSSGKTVPVPPNRLRKKNVIAKNKRDANDKRLKMKNDRGQSVAYVVILPLEDSKSTSLEERAAVLAASIRNAHDNSLQNYQLYAINYEDSSDGTEKRYICDQFCSETMATLGYNVVDVSTSELDRLVHDRYKATRSVAISTLNALLESSIVVNIGLDSLLLKPIDDSMFDQISNGRGSGMDEKKHSDILSLNDGTLQSADEQFYIFKPSSKEATLSYLQYLYCLTSKNTIGKGHPSTVNNHSIQRRDNWQPTLYPKIRRLVASAMPKPILKEYEVASSRKQCTIATKAD